MIFQSTLENMTCSGEIFTSGHKTDHVSSASWEQENTVKVALFFKVI